MLDFKTLSFWEKQYLTEQIDFLIVGSGIVGAACALELKHHYPDAKIIILERGYLPSGASTKNAGFACFGSATELVDDLSKMPETAVWDTVSMRYEGLNRLLERFPQNSIDYRPCGSYDLIGEHDTEVEIEKLNELNYHILKITGQNTCFSIQKEFIQNYGFLGFKLGYFNRLEGSIDTLKLWEQTETLLFKNSIKILNGITVKSWQDSSCEVIVDTNFGELKAAKLFIATNGLSQSILPDKDLKPARAQVVVTSPIQNLKFNETFHYDSGYYYFRTIGNRILLGGGRNLDFEGETTSEMITTTPIINRLITLLNEQIIPGSDYKIDYSWSGIMGVGSEKRPIVEKISNHVAIGIRMGGMGVAIGSEVGEKLAHLLD